MDVPFETVSTPPASPGDCEEGEVLRPSSRRIEFVEIPPSPGQQVCIRRRSSRAHSLDLMPYATHALEKAAYQQARKKKDALEERRKELEDVVRKHNEEKAAMQKRSAKLERALCVARVEERLGQVPQHSSKEVEALLEMCRGSMAEALERHRKRLEEAEANLEALKLSDNEEAVIRGYEARRKEEESRKSSLSSNANTTPATPAIATLVAATRRLRLGAPPPSPPAPSPPSLPASLATERQSGRDIPWWRRKAAVLNLSSQPRLTVTHRQWLAAKRKQAAEAKKQRHALQAERAKELDSLETRRAERVAVLAALTRVEEEAGRKRRKKKRAPREPSPTLSSCLHGFQKSLLSCGPTSRRTRRIHANNTTPSSPSLITYDTELCL